MTEIIGVRFKSEGKVYYFNPNGMKVAEGQKVIIETARGVEFGECAQTNTMVDEMTIISPLRMVLRVATPADEARVAENKKKEAKAFDICQKKILAHKLEMKLVDVEYNFEGNKILFFFTADGRVDFRELVRDLASVFHTRIELRQIGVRDEAKMLGGLGVCGRPFCCTSFLEDFQPVSIKMAKTQSLSLNPTKISGTCGRLMCCLKYEQDAYEDALKRMPKQDSLVETPDGVGVINQVNLLREQVKVRLDQAPDMPKYYKAEDITVIRSGKGKRPEGYELPEPEVKPAPAPRRSGRSNGENAGDKPGDGNKSARPPRRRESGRPLRQGDPLAPREPRFAPVGDKPEKPVPQPQPAAENAAPAAGGESAGDKPRRRRRPRRRKPRPEGGQPPKAEE